MSHGFGDPSELVLRAVAFGQCGEVLFEHMLECCFPWISFRDICYSVEVYIYEVVALGQSAMVTNLFFCFGLEVDWLWVRTCDLLFCWAFLSVFRPVVLYSQTVY